MKAIQQSQRATLKKNGFGEEKATFTVAFMYQLLTEGGF